MLIGRKEALTRNKRLYRQSKWDKLKEIASVFILNFIKLINVTVIIVLSTTLRKLFDKFH